MGCGQHAGYGRLAAYGAENAADALSGKASEAGSGNELRAARGGAVRKIEFFVKLRLNG